MLSYSEYRPAEIALTLAFPSQSYFTEVFHKYTGLTPKEYRKQYLNITLDDNEIEE
jgi:AraC-like DNA-binding protein